MPRDRDRDRDDDDFDDDRPRKRRSDSPGVLLIFILAVVFVSMGCCGAVLFLMLNIGFAVKEFPEGMKRKRAEERMRSDAIRQARDQPNR